MNRHTYLVLTLIIELLVFVAGVVSAMWIGYSAWNGRPKNFSKEMYWTAFGFALVFGSILIAVSRAIELTGPFQLLLHTLCFLTGLLLCTISMGCLAAAILYRGPTFSSSGQK